MQKIKWKDQETKKIENQFHSEVEVSNEEENGQKEKRFLHEIRWRNRNAGRKREKKRWKRICLTGEEETSKSHPRSSPSLSPSPPGKDRPYFLNLKTSRTSSGEEAFRMASIFSFLEKTAATPAMNWMCGPEELFGLRQSTKTFEGSPSMESK